MNLHEAVLNDLDQVFFNLDEFACVHQFNGRNLACIVDDSEAAARTGGRGDFTNQSGIGVLSGSRVVYCKAADIIPQPLPGEKVEMDGKYWIVPETGLSEVEGLLTLPLNRMY